MSAHRLDESISSNSAPTFSYFLLGVLVPLCLQLSNVALRLEQPPVSPHNKHGHTPRSFPLSSACAACRLCTGRRDTLQVSNKQHSRTRRSNRMQDLSVLASARTKTSTSTKPTSLSCVGRVGRRLVVTCRSYSGQVCSGLLIEAKDLAEDDGWVLCHAV